MASFQTLENGKIQARIRKKGHHASEVFENLKIAEAWAKREETRIDKAEAGIFEDDKKITIAELIIKWKTEAGYKQKGFEVNKYHLVKLPSYILNLRVKTMTRAPFERYMEESKKAGYAPATIVRRIDMLRSIVNWGIRKITQPPRHLQNSQRS
jgi:hypothetical protein